MGRELVRAGGIEPPVSGFVAQCPGPLNDARMNTREPWQPGKASNLQPPHSERGAPPIELPGYDYSLQWGDRRELNSRGAIHSRTPDHSATVTSGARGTSRTCLSGFSDRRLDRNGLPDEPGGRGGNRTLICWLQASGPPFERLPPKTGCGLAG
jgi:hypothetical protein